MKIKIFGKGFDTTHFGYFKANTEVSCSDSFAKYVVEKMKAGAYVEKKKTRGRPKNESS